MTGHARAPRGESGAPAPGAEPAELGLCAVTWEARVTLSREADHGAPGAGTGK